jgi:hypothetical protein
VYHHALGFIDHHYPVVFVKDVQGDILGNKPRRIRGGPGQFQEIPGFNGPGNFYLPPVETGLQVFSFNLGTGEESQPLRHIPVQPDFGGDPFHYTGIAGQSIFSFRGESAFGNLRSRLFFRNFTLPGNPGGLRLRPGGPDDNGFPRGQPGGFFFIVMPFNPLDNKIGYRQKHCPAGGRTDNDEVFILGHIDRSGGFKRPRRIPGIPVVMVITPGIHNKGRGKKGKRKRTEGYYFTPP